MSGFLSAVARKAQICPDRTSFDGAKAAISIIERYYPLDRFPQKTL